MSVSTKMGRVRGSGVMLVIICLVIYVSCNYAQNSGNAIPAVYIVTLKHAPTSHYWRSELRVNQGPHIKSNGSQRMNRLDKTRIKWHNGSYIAGLHDSLLKRTLRGEKYLKVYTYHYLINGFAVLVTPHQADRISRRREVLNVVMDFSVRTVTIHTPQFLGLPLSVSYICLTLKHENILLGCMHVCYNLLHKFSYLSCK